MNSMQVKDNLKNIAVKRNLDFNTLLRLYMYDRLRQLGIPAVLTRDYDENLSRTERLKRANTAFGDSSNAILISNHINAGGGDGHCVTKYV